MADPADRPAEGEGAPPAGRGGAQAGRGGAQAGRGGVPAGRRDEPAGGARPLRDRIRRAHLRSAAITERTEALVAENRRLRAALASIIAGRADSARRDPARRLQLLAGVVERAGSGEGRRWMSAVCSVAVERLPSVDACAVSLRPSPGSRRLLAASDTWAEALDELEYSLGEGPTVDALAGRHPVVVHDLRHGGERWPGYTLAVSGTGLAGVISLPLALGDSPAGSVSLFSRHPSSPAAPELQDAALLTEVASAVALADLDRAAGADDLAGVGYDLVSIASGMLSVRHDVSLEDARALLRARAFSTGRSTAEVAADVVARRDQVD